MHHFRTPLITAIFISLAFLAVPAFAQGFTFGLRPEDQSIAYFQYSLQPGESLEDAVLAVNGTQDPVRLMVTVVAGHTELTGGVSFPGVADGPAAWIELPDEGLVEVPPELALRMPFTLTVPEGTPAGEYVAGFLATPEDPSAFAGEVSEGAFQVQVIPQMAVSMIITVPGPEHTQIDVNALSDELNKGQWKIVINMTNSGNIHFLGHGEFTLRPVSGGEPVLQRTFSIGYFIAGDTIGYPLYFDDLPPAGSYIAEVRIIGDDYDYQTTFEQLIELSGEEVQLAAEEAAQWSQAQQDNPATGETDQGSQSQQTSQETVSQEGGLDRLQIFGFGLLGLAGVSLVVLVIFIVSATRKERKDKA
jgi:hypothetical protein